MDSLGINLFTFSLQNVTCNFVILVMEVSQNAVFMAFCQNYSSLPPCPLLPWRNRDKTNIEGRGLAWGRRIFITSKLRGENSRLHSRMYAPQDALPDWSEPPFRQRMRPGFLSQIASSNLTSNCVTYNLTVKCVKATSSAFQ